MLEQSEYSLENVIPSCFHIVDRYCDLDWYVPPATHGFHNFMLVVSGKGICLTDGTRYDMHPGTLIYHHSGQSFGFETSKTELMHSFGVNFNVAAVTFSSGNWLLENVEKLPFENYMKVSDMPILEKNFTHLVDVWEEGRKDSQLKVRSIFMNILYEVSRQLRFQQNSTKPERDLEPVIAYIRKHYSEHITLQALAEMTGLNPNYFSSVFKKQCGRTPVEYINSIRVEKAQELLGIGYSVSTVSSMVGFNDPFYFSKVFRKCSGISPSAYSRTPLDYC